MNNLEIKRENRGDEIILKCSGRLDANWAGHLNDYIDELVREGHYYISLNMMGIEYLSSAGIRSLVTQYKNLKSVNGHFHIVAMSDNVNEVLNMVGMLDMLSQKPEKPIADKDKKETPDQITINDFRFDLSKLSENGKTAITFYGDPELLIESGFKEENARLLKSEENQFAIGLGAIGDSYQECKNRFGEYLMLGKNIAYLPADGSKKPDYMLSSGKLIASLTELYGLHFTGNFSHILRFDSKILNATIGISELVEGINKVSKFNNFAIVMVAESGGLIGTSLNSSPVDGKKIFDFPEIKDTFNFTTEPAYNKMLSLSVGCFSFEKNEKNKRFLRPMQTNSGILGHIHSAVFPYVPLKKTNISLSETIDQLFHNSELTDILHLVNDTREIVGMGESQFVNGFCWIVPIESITTISTP